MRSSGEFQWFERCLGLPDLIRNLRKALKFSLSVAGTGHMSDSPLRRAVIPEGRPAFRPVASLIVPRPDLSSMPQVTEDPLLGQPAPAFCLPDAGKKTVCLEQFRGTWVVLYFYPKDNTAGCTLEAVQFTAALEEFAALWFLLKNQDFFRQGTSAPPCGSPAGFGGSHGVSGTLKNPSSRVPSPTSKTRGKGWYTGRSI